MKPAKVAPIISSVVVSPVSGPAGTTFSAKIRASGTHPQTVSYKWLLDGAQLAGATGPSYVASMAGSLIVVVTVRNSEGSDTRESNAAQVTPGATAPEVRAFMVPAQGEVGDTFTVVTEASGVPFPEIEYLWYLDGLAIPGANDVSCVPSGPGSLSAVVIARNSEGSSSTSCAATVSPMMEAPKVLAVSVAPALGRVGDTFLASVSASGTPDPDLAFQWALGGQPIVGATTPQHTAEAEGELIVTVVATNAAGSASLTSTPVPVDAALSVPVNIALPTISGVPQVGQTLTAMSDGAWSGNPTPTLSRNWQRNGVDIVGATGETYAPQITDADSSIRLRVTAANSEGSATVASAPVAAPPLSAPRITTLSISPTSGTVGATFTAGLTVAGNPTVTISRQWRLDGVDIPGASSPVFTSTSPGQLTVFVVASNSEGAESLLSAPTVIEPPAGPVVFVEGVYMSGVYQ